MIMFSYLKGNPYKDFRTALRRACCDAGIPYGRGTKDGLSFMIPVIVSIQA
jgi:hypothetical protein